MFTSVFNLCCLRKISRYYNQVTLEGHLHVSFSACDDKRNSILRCLWKQHVSLMFGQQWFLGAFPFPIELCGGNCSHPLCMEHEPLYNLNNVKRLSDMYGASIVVHLCLWHIVQWSGSYIYIDLNSCHKNGHEINAAKRYRYGNMRDFHTIDGYKPATNGALGTSSQKISPLSFKWFNIWAFDWICFAFPSWRKEGRPCQRRTLVNVSGELASLDVSYTWWYWTTCSQNLSTSKYTWWNLDASDAFSLRNYSLRLYIPPHKSIWSTPTRWIHF